MRFSWAGRAGLGVAGLLVAGCAPRSSAPAVERPAPHVAGPAPGSLVAIRKQAMSSAAHGPRADRIDHLLARSAALGLTADQVARIRRIRTESMEDQRVVARAADDSRRRAQALAVRSNVHGDVSLQQVRTGLASASALDRKLVGVRAAGWGRALRLLTPTQRARVESR